VSRRAFTVTWDYRCPFARNAHEHLVVALQDGAPWDVTFSPFSLSQLYVEEGGLPVWEDPAKARDLMALLAGVVVRDRYPDHFLEVHAALFGARHDQGRDLRVPEVLSEVLEESGVPGADVLAEVEKEWPRQETRQAHEWSVAKHEVFGVPTFVLGPDAVFVRLTSRPEGDATLARTTIDQILDLIESHGEINEFKHTTVAN
jgi:hypothetical protein